jgi:hypothetical protein
MSSTQAISFTHPSLPAARNSVRDRPREPRGIVGFILLLFLLSCIFDPADRVLSLKVWLFLLCWAVTVFVCVSSRTQIGVPRELLLYILLFILIPLFSIVWFWLTNGGPRFEGFNLLKGYLLITLAPMLVLNRINLLPLLCAVLTVLALSVIGVFVALQIMPELFAALYLFGPSTGILFVDNRSYGANVTLLQVYFVTSPMLVIAIAYYFHRARSAQRLGARVLFWALVSINVLGMLLAGSRNNIVVSFLLPIALSFLYARNRIIGALFGMLVVTLLAVVFADQLAAFFDPAEQSNSAKLSLLQGYLRIFSEPLPLIFGQGLGAYDDWERGSLYITEFTYLELVRNFGLLGAMVMLGLLLFPIWHAFAARRSRAERAIAVGFAFYLLMCFSNPNLFSSMGILILSVMVANIFLPTGAPGKATTRRGP